MFERTLQDITAYIDFLRARGYAVTVSDFDKVLEPALTTFIMYELSPLPICDFLRNDKATRQACLAHRSPLAGQGVRYCACHAGVEEFVVPIKHGEDVIVYVHVTGYRGKLCTKEQLAQIYAQYGLEDCVAQAMEGLDPNVPEEREVLALVRPLSYMFERLWEQCCEYTNYTPVLDAYSKSLIYIRDHYAEGISVADVAKAIGYSVSYFGYIFKKTRGISANRYISELQLGKACELLRGTALSVSDIAERVGFGDANYFSTAFKARYGLTPRQYRAQQR